MWRASAPSQGGQVRLSVPNVRLDAETGWPARLKAEVTFDTIESLDHGVVQDRAEQTNATIVPLLDKRVQRPLLHLGQVMLLAPR